VSAFEALLGDEGPVPRRVLATQVVEETRALADHQQQAAPAVVVVLVGSKVLGEVVDALGEQGDLDLRGCGVALVGAVLGNDLRCGFHHALVSRAKGDCQRWYHLPVPKPHSPSTLSSWPRRGSSARRVIRDPEEHTSELQS